MKKRINPKTGNIFKQGDVRKDGYIFKSYEYIETTDGFWKEKWMSEERHLRWRMFQAIKTSKRSRKRGSSHQTFENNLDIDYLISIFPKDWRCPVLGVDMEFGEGSKAAGIDNSPSLDRINPKIGYVKGNVQWLSYKVNRMKSDQTLEKVIKLGNWAERIQREGIESAREYLGNL
jgi:hypothetical protein